MEANFEKNKRKYRYQNEDKSFWKKHIAAFKAIGNSRKEYCKIHLLNYDRFAYWIKKLSPELITVKTPPSTDRVRLLPVKMEKERTVENFSVLCRLTLTNGAILSIYDERVLSIILSRGM